MKPQRSQMKERILHAIMINQRASSITSRVKQIIQEGKRTA